MDSSILQVKQHVKKKIVSLLDNTIFAAKVSKIMKSNGS